ncbi:MAG TPA: hypothetical protein VKZ63_03250 [Kofleriaceae bacterium]|nr:hypothetical protein [Kofleriaceae bacterium]
MSAIRPTARLSSRALRARAAALVCAFLLGHLGGFIHQATASHARCAEHGELVHGEAGEADGEARVARGVEAWIAALARDAVQDDLRGLPADSDHEHDHCWVRCAERARSGAAHGSGVAAPAATGCALALAGLAIQGAGALYRTAPKTSPPA